MSGDGKKKLVLGSHVSYYRELFAIKMWTMYTRMDNLYGYFIHHSHSHSL